VNAIINFITGRKSAWVTLLLGLVFAALAFGPLAAKSSETNPGIGLPASTESVIVNEKLAELPGADSTAAVIVYAADQAMTAEQKLWVQGTFDQQAQSFVGGAGDRFAEFSNVEVMGKKFVPPAQLSNDEATAVITVPLEKSEKTEVITERVKDLRAIAKDGMPAGLTAYVTGPEGFQADRRPAACRHRFGSYRSAFDHLPQPNSLDHSACRGWCCRPDGRQASA
jgi:putative drug exporter of the RND superfamily